MSDEVISRGTCVVDDVEKAAGSPLITPHAYLCFRAIVLEHEIVSGLRGWERRDGAQDAADDLHVQVRGWNACRRMDRQIGMKSQEGLVFDTLRTARFGIDIIMGSLPLGNRIFAFPTTA